jgi:hypothetical protein
MILPRNAPAPESRAALLRCGPLELCAAPCTPPHLSLFRCRRGPPSRGLHQLALRCHSPREPNDHPPPPPPPGSSTSSFPLAPELAPAPSSSNCAGDPSFQLCPSAFQFPLQLSRHSDPSQIPPLRSRSRRRSLHFCSGSVQAHRISFSPLTAHASNFQASPICRCSQPRSS